MRWEDEPYVRVYRRDTPKWLMLPWEARLVFNELLKHCDRAGLIELGEYGADSLAVVMRIPSEVAQRSLDAWLKDGCVQMLDGGVLFVRNYREAQEARQSDKVRKQNERERAAADAKAAALGIPVTNRDEPSQGVTKRHDSSHGVTSGHTQNSAVLGQCSGSARAEEACGHSPAPAVAPGEVQAESPPPQPEASPGATQKPKAKDRRAGQVIALWCDLWREAKGIPYQVAGKAAGAAKTLASWPAATDEEISRRFGAAVVDSWLSDKLDLPLFVANWNRLGTGPPARDWRKGRVGAEEIKHSEVTGIVQWGSRRERGSGQAGPQEAAPVVPGQVGPGPAGAGATGGAMGGPQGEARAGAGSAPGPAP